MSARQTAESFWKRVRRRGPDDCWLWLGARNKPNAYGMVGWHGKQYLTHRVAYALTHGTPMASPKDRKGPGFVLHRCDNKLCCNPRHLYLGTYSQNLLDAWSRGQKVFTTNQWTREAA